MRCFIAFPIPENVKRVLLTAQNELKRNNPDARVSWTKAEQWHITTLFLGEINEMMIENIKQILEQILHTYHSFTFKLQYLDAFPNMLRPSVLVVKAIDETGEASKFVKELKEAITKLGIANIDNKPWVPHLTLGRVKSFIGTSSTSSAGGRDLSLPSGIEQIEWTINKVELIKSELLPGGSRYTILEGFRLQ